MGAGKKWEKKEVLEHVRSNTSLDASGETAGILCEGRRPGPFVRAATHAVGFPEAFGGRDEAGGELDRDEDGLGKREKGGQSERGYNGNSRCTCISPPRLSLLAYSPIPIL